MRVIELDIYNTKMTVEQATEEGKEYIVALDTARMINTLIFKQTDGKTRKQIGLIIGEVRRFCNSLEHEILEMAKANLSTEGTKAGKR